jgi:hypothetical protein
MEFESSVSGCKGVITAFCQNGNLGITALMVDGLILSRDPERRTDRERSRPMNGERSAGRKAQWDGLTLIELPAVFAMEADAQTNQTASDKKESL